MLAPELSLEQWVAVASAAVAVVSFVFNWGVVSRQTTMQAEGLKSQMDADVLRWARAAIDALAHAALVARSRGALADEVETRRQAAEVSARLSALADQGRLFFPNLEHPSHGRDKELAFQGFRPPVLDALVFACQRMERLDPRNLGPDEETHEFLVRCRRLLVSEVQRAVDPRRRGRMMKRLALSGGDESGGPTAIAQAAALGMELEAAQPGTLVQRRDAAWVAKMEKLVKG